MVLLIVWIVVVVLALVVLGAIGYGVLGAAGRLGRELEAAERDVRPLLEQAQASTGRPRRAERTEPTRANPRADRIRTPSGVASPVPPTSGGPVMGSLGPLEIGLIILAILLLFGYKKLPDASRSLGRSLRIFKGEMKGMKDDDVRDAQGRRPDDARPRRDRPPRPRPASGDLTAQLHEEARSPRPAPPSSAPAPSRPARPTAPADPPAPGRTTVSEAGRGPRVRRRRPPRDAEATMSLIAHLTELRNRIAKALLALLVATAVAFWWYDHGLGDFIRAPYCNLPADLRYGGDDGRLRPADHRRLRRRLHPAQGRLPRRRRAVRAVLALPALGVHHARASSATRSATAIGFVAVSTLLFAAGAVLAYISLAKGLQLLLSPGRRRRGRRADRAGLHRLRALAAGRVRGELRGAADRGRAQPGRRAAATRCSRKSRRWIFFLTIVFAAFVTPTQDPFTMLLMAGPMIVLFEGAIQIARVVDKRRAKREARRGLPRRRRRRGLAAGRRARRRWTTRSTTTATAADAADPMDVAVLVSPAAGRGRAGVLADDVLAAFRAAGLTPRLLPATTGADAERQAAEAVAAGRRRGRRRRR